MTRRTLLLAGPAALAAAPPKDFAFTSATQVRESLSKYRGRPVALYFFNPG